MRTALPVWSLLCICAGAGQIVAQALPGPSAEELQKITAAAPERAPAAPRRPRRLLVFNHNEGFNHTSIPYGAAAIEIMGKKTGAFEAVQSDDLRLFTAKGLAPFDAIVLNNGYAFKLDPAAQQALMEFVRDGKGLVGIHAASANFEGWPQGTDLFGAKFKNHPWGPTAAWAMKNEAPAHPINAAFGGQDFRIADEIYAFTDFRRDRSRVLLSLDLADAAVAAVPHEDTDVPVSWIHTLGEGRVFYCSLGHQHEIFWTPALLAHLLAGIQFALGDLQEDDGNAGAALLEVERLGDALEAALRAAAGDPAKLAQLERQMLDVMRSSAGPQQKRAVGERLSWIATPASVPVMAPLLSDPELSHTARTVLERVGVPEGVAALRAALPRLVGPLKAGAIGSLGRLRDRQAVSALASLMTNPDPVVAGAAINALGRIGGLRAAQALVKAYVPQGLQPLLDDACAACAESLASEGQPAQAEALYAALTNARQAPRTRALGLRGLTAIGSAQALPRALACLQAPEAELAQAAARLCASFPAAQTWNRLLAAYPQLRPATQVALVTALAEKGDAAALPVALKALASPDPNVRAAAIPAAAALGGPRAVRPLAEIAAHGAGPDHQAAREQLARLPGRPAETAILRLVCQGTPQVRAALMSVLADRRMTATIPILLQAARSSDLGVAVEALRALGRMAGPQEYPDLLGLMLSADGTEEQSAAQGAVVAVAGRLGDPDQAAEPLVTALPDASPGQQCLLLETLAGIGGDHALAALTAATASGDAQVRLTAIQALAEGWEDPRPLPTLWEIAQAEPDSSAGVLSLRGCLRLLGRQAATQPQQTVAQLEQALAVARRPEEKKQALGVLGNCRVEAAMELAARYLDDPQLFAEAAEVVLALAGSQPPAVSGPAAAAALEKAVSLRGTTLPIGWQAHDLGVVGTPGWVTQAEGTFTLKASGWDIWGTADGGLLVGRPLAGDGRVVARVVSLDPTDPWAKAGVMVRASPVTGAANAFMAITPANGADFQRRTRPGSESQYTNAGQDIAAPYWVRLDRVGDAFTAFLSADGREWRRVGQATVPMEGEVLAGLALTSHNNSLVARAVFDQVSVTPLAADEGRAGPGERLRVLIVTGGHGFEREAFFQVFDGIPEIEWREVEHPQANQLYAPDHRGEYDVLLLYDLWQEISEKEKTWFLELLQQGKGLLVMHHALANYQQWPEYARLLGGRFFLEEQEWRGRKWAPSTWREGVHLPVKIADRQHPITRGLQEFAVEDEVYGGFWVSPRAHPLLTTNHPECGRTIGWTSAYSRSRVAYLMVGHGSGAFRDESFRTLVRRALLWVAGRL